MLFLKFLLIFCVQGMEVPQAKSQLMTEYLQNEVWLAELEATEAQEAKLRFWWKKQSQGMEQVRAYRGDARGLNGMNNAVELTGKANELSNSIREKDEKKLGGILNESQRLRANQLWNWLNHRKTYTNSAVHTLCATPTHRTLMLDLDELGSIRAEFRREENELVTQYEIEIREIIESLITKEMYDKIHGRDYQGMKLNGPLRSVSTLQFLAHEFQGPGEKVKRINHLAMFVSKMRQMKAEENPKASGAEMEELALKGTYEQLDSFILEMKFERLSVWFIRESLGQLGNGIPLNIDAREYLNLTTSQIDQARLQIEESNRNMNSRYAEMQLRQFEKFKAVISPESRELVETQFGRPPVSMFWYQHALGRKNFLKSVSERR